MLCLNDEKNNDHLLVDGALIEPGNIGHLGAQDSCVAKTREKHCVCQSHLAGEEYSCS